MSGSLFHFIVFGKWCLYSYIFLIHRLCWLYFIRSNLYELFEISAIWTSCSDELKHIISHKAHSSVYQSIFLVSHLNLRIHHFLTDSYTSSGDDNSLSNGWNESHHGIWLHVGIDHISYLSLQYLYGQMFLMH